MRKQKNILLFLDLEGTILRETDGDYDQESMYQFLGQLDTLQSLTDSNINIHLVSPVYQKQMEAIIDRIDRDITRYNKLHPEHNNIPEIECGSFLPNPGAKLEELFGNKTIALKMPKDSRQMDTSIYGKANYVKQWCEMYQERSGLFMAIYGGNGINDLAAMSYIKEQKAGFVICPSNCRPQAQSKADFVSEKRNLLGITEGIQYINEQIKKRSSNIPQQEIKQGEQK